MKAGIVRLIGAVVLAGLCPVPSSAAENEAPAAAADAGGFMAAATTYANCLRAAVELGMRLKVEPAEFESTFAGACLAEERTFRAEGVRQAMRLGRTEAEAVAEVDGNIANGRVIFAADQASYLRTGRVPR